MKALLLRAPSRLEVTEIPDPEYAADEVLVRVRACGICGSDIHGWDGTSGRRRPPLVMGHEAAGEIVAVGGSVQRWRIGDRVAFDSTIYCGHCVFCLSGRVNLCQSRMVIGVATPEYTRQGAFAEFVAVPDRVLYRLPEGISWVQGAMVEPMSIAVHAVGKLSSVADAVVAVVGSGMIGLFVVQVLRAKGARRIIAIDLEESRLDLALRLGATDAVNPGSDSVSAAISNITGGMGVDAAFEVVGAGKALETAVQCVRRGGDLVLIGNVSSRVELPLQDVVTREIRMHGSCASAGEYPECLELIAAGSVEVESMISAVAPLDEGPAWFGRLSGAAGRKSMKIILTP